MKKKEEDKKEKRLKEWVDEAWLESAKGRERAPRM